MVLNRGKVISYESENTSFSIHPIFHFISNINNMGISNIDEVVHVFLTSQIFIHFLLWHPMKNRHPLKIEKSDKCHYNGLIRRYFTSLLLLTHSSRS